MKHLLFALSWLLLGDIVWADTSPLTFVRSNVERVVAILENPDLRGETHKRERRAQLERITEDFFDTQELARRSLGQYWRALSPGEQTEFAALFVELIKQTYLDKLDVYNNQGIRYEEEIMQSPTQAVVRFSVATDKGPLRVEINLISGPTGWRAFDITVENVSLVRNFRTQFQSILQSHPPQHLIAILKERIHGPNR